MKATHTTIIALAALAFTACEDYTEHNFGTREELYTPTQVSTIRLTLANSDYENLAKDTAAVRIALSADDDSATYRDLLSVAQKKYFRGNITPEEYLLPMLLNLVGSNRYYSMTAGSNIVITYRAAADSIVNVAAYVPATSFAPGDYLMVPQGEEQVLAGSGADVSYGELYLSGSSRYPNPVTHLTATAISVDATSRAYLYTFARDAEHYTIRNAEGMYLYMDDTHASFQYTDDIDNDVDDRTFAQWDVAKNDDGTFDIVNVATGKDILYSTSYSSAGCYSDKKGTDGYLSLLLYKVGTVSTIVDATPEEGEVTFTLDEDGWSAKGDYLNQALTGWASTNVDDIFAALGWSIEYEGGIGNLNYVFRADAMYGLRASAYVSGNYTPTDVLAISPSMNFKKAKAPILVFQQAQKYAGTPVTDYLQVWVSTDYQGRGHRADATWTDVTMQVEGVWPDGSSWDFSDMSLDLSAYVGQTNVVVGFHYVSTETQAATWEVKNIRCAEAEE
ncbi:MAG: DUF5017 domain-containing protein [Bacteroidaceae bacterium]|nr:DUF5017 domain-containing protein [Bacteroidaceae bacterium]